MATIEELKRRVDLHDLAERLGMERPGDRGNYRSPVHQDRHPSLSVFNDGTSWYDHSTEQGGSCVDLVMYVEGLAEVGDAVRRLHELYDLPMERQAQQENRQRSIPEFVADRCVSRARENDEELLAYLRDERCISTDAIRHAVRRGSLGFNDYRSDKRPEGEPGHLGPAAAFVVRTRNPGHVVAVDMRFVDPATNGDVKTWTQGEKRGFVWTADWKRVEKARTVYVVESATNALSVDSVGRSDWAAVATRGTAGVDEIDWRFLAGKRVVICMDNDPPHEKHNNQPPGARSAWKLHEHLTGLNISAHLVDQAGWDGLEGPQYNDLNDILQDAEGNAAALRGYLLRLEQGIIPGIRVERSDDRPGFRREQRPRIWLPAFDLAQYPKFRCKEDFTTYVKKWGDDEDQTPQFADLCGFRVAGLARVRVASATATMTGEDDIQPETLFAVSVQTPRHGNQLVRRVFEDERLHNVEQWQKFGPIYARSQFQRMVNILERAAPEIGAREAVNFVGLAWQKGKPLVNEGADCYFTEPDKQCPYHNLAFPAGGAGQARRVIDAYSGMFRHNAALQLLVWALGGHLKAFLGFWPHLVLQAGKGAGKSTLVKWLERTIGMTMFSGQSLQTEFRLLTSISHTSHPVGWEEISARRVDVIDKAVSLLQECYQYTTTRRGSDMTEYLLAAPVLLAGEDVPVRSLLGKLTRVELAQRKGELPPEDLPRFPVRQWLEFLAGHHKSQISAMYRSATEHAMRSCRASGSDDGATRMAGNYAATMVAWRLLAEFAGVDFEYRQFPQDLFAEMNAHIAETSADREPWVWVLETICDEISSHSYRHPYKFALVDGVECLILRPQHVMHHLRHSIHLRQTFDGLPIKSDRILRRQLEQAEVIHKDRVDARIGGKRECHMVALSLERLAAFGLHVSQPEEIDYEGDHQVA
ncbi:toprim domain-containing protein [Ectothiorhodospiraceae bacterium WFHF3C12]|nr:toprim domain-containing protein [Ectothiorhodospiraceae bacterium WFHF3C12]